MNLTTKKDKFAIIAGNGNLPRLVADKLENQNKNFICLCFDEKNYDYFSSLNYKTYKISLKKLSDIKKILKNEKINKVVCCGGVKFCGLKNIKINFFIIKYFIKAYFSRQKGDNFLLLLAEKMLNDIGCCVISVQDVLPDVLVQKKDEILTGFNNLYIKDIVYGKEILSTLSKFDIGQSIVVQNGRVVGIEGLEGTKELIERCGKYCKDNKKEKPVLIKTSKTNQTMKLDVPSIGEETIKQLIANNFAGLALEENSVILIEKEKVLNMLKTNNIFLKVI